MLKLQRILFFTGLCIFPSLFCPSEVEEVVSEEKSARESIKFVHALNYGRIDRARSDDLSAICNRLFSSLQSLLEGLDSFEKEVISCRGEKKEKALSQLSNIRATVAQAALKAEQAAQIQQKTGGYCPRLATQSSYATNTRALLIKAQLFTSRLVCEDLIFFEEMYLKHIEDTLQIFNFSKKFDGYIPPLEESQVAWLENKQKQIKEIIFALKILSRSDSILGSLCFTLGLNQSKTCSICHEVGKCLLMTKCEHEFCASCLAEWANRSLRQGVPCPMCRKSLLKEESQAE